MLFIHICIKEKNKVCELINHKYDMRGEEKVFFELSKSTSLLLLLNLKRVDLLFN